MQVTLTIPDELAAELVAAGRDPSRSALEALTLYQRLLHLAEEDEAIRQGLEDIAEGRTRPLDEVFDEMRAKYAIPR
jgi:predicted transcriptional regulator